MRPQAENRPSVLAPVMVLCLFAALIPAPMPRHSSGVSSEECLTLADTADRRPLALLEQCHAFYPTDVELLADLGARYERIDVSRAELTYQRALELDPDYADLRLRLGRLLLRRGAAIEAASQAEAALRIQPNRQALLTLLRDARAAGRHR